MGGVVSGGDGEGRRGQKAHTMVWVSTTTHPPLLPRLPTLSLLSAKNLLHFYEKQGRLGGVRRLWGPRSPMGTRKTRGAGWTMGTRMTRKTRGLGRLRELGRLGRLGRRGGLGELGRRGG